MTVYTIRLVSFAAALVATLAWASTGLALDDTPLKDEALEGLTEALEKAEKGEPAKPDGPAQEPAPAEKSGAGAEAAVPEDKGAVAPKDQALDSLLEKLGETTEAPAPKEKPAGGPKPPDEPAPPEPAKSDKPDSNELKGPDKSLDEELESRAGRRRKRDKDQEGEGSGPLAQVIKEMRDVEQRLQEPDTGEATRKKQAEIVKNLDTIIEQLRSTSSNSKSKSMRTAMQAGQKPGSQSGTNPGSDGGQAPNAMPARPSGKQGPADARGKDEWGHLPEELRQEMANVFKEEYLTSKFDLIRRYYLSVSRKSLVREE